MKNLAITLNAVSYSYKSNINLFRKPEVISPIRGLDLNVYNGELLGVAGKNGSGKSTLLRILAGVVKPSSGTIRNMGYTTALLTLGFGLNPNVSGRRNVIMQSLLMGVALSEAKKIANKVKELSEINDFFERPVRTYSSGMRARLAFCTAVQANADILLIDEMMSVGDKAFREKSEHIMHRRIKSGGGVVIVSHNAKFMSKFCDRIVEL